MHSDARTLIAVRVVVVTTLLLASLIIQFTVRELLPINYIYLTAGLAYALTLGYIGVGQVIPSRRVNLMVQIAGDLIVETLLVYFTGGLNSPFSFLYLVSIITASMLLFRRGGLLAASGSAILYGVLCDLMYFNIVPLPQQTFLPMTTWTSSRVYFNIATNLAGFYATALLTSYISEKLQKTSEELNANRQNLAELRALNQNVVESIPSGLVTLSNYGTATFVNPAACQILQTSTATLLGHHITDLNFFTIDEWNEARERLGAGAVVRNERDFILGGITRSIGYAATSLSTLEGKPAGYTLIFQDLTDMKKLESELRLKDRMAAVGELSAGIAHEIRNPLAAIAGSVQVLKNSSSLSTQEQRLMSIVLKESERLNKSIADFLRFVRPQEKMSVQFDVAASLSETLELFANSSELRDDHKIERDIEPPSFNLVGDADQIRQVFWNLARNAVQAMPNGGAVRIRTRAEGLELVRVTVTDQGVGIAPEDVDKIFKLYYTSKPGGSGIGLSVVYRIVQLHDGSVEAKSQVGKGTALIVRLPVR
jgi:two-component system sensor histidine kinase PilS (NtrC family)